MVDSNFLNLKFFGVDIAGLSESDVMESIGVQGQDAHTALHEEYDKCITEQLGSLNAPDTPTDRTDPKQREHFETELKPGDEEVFEGELESGEKFREFEGFQWDMGKPGVIEYNKREAQRVALIQDRRRFLGQDPETGEFGQELMPEKLEDEEYRRQVDAQLKPTAEEWEKMVHILDSKELTLSDKEFWDEMGYSDPKINYILGNKDELEKEYGDIYRQVPR